MKDEHLDLARTAMTRIVSEKIPGAKRWSVSREYKSWIHSLSKDQFQVYLDKLRLLTRTLSDEGLSDQETPKQTGTVVFFGSYPPSQIKSRERLGQIGGEAAAYYALALWRSLQAEELRKGLSGDGSDPQE